MGWDWYPSQELYWRSKASPTSKYFAWQFCQSLAVVELNDAFKTPWLLHQKSGFSGDLNKFFSSRGSEFPHLTQEAHIWDLCEPHRASASESLGFKNTNSRAPDLRRKQNTCTVNGFPCGEFYAHHGLRSSVPENSQSYTNANILGFPYVHTLEAKTNKGQELWTKRGLSPLGKPPETRLSTWTILHSTHPKQSRTSLF